VIFAEILDESPLPGEAGGSHFAYHIRITHITLLRLPVCQSNAKILQNARPDRRFVEARTYDCHIVALNFFNPDRTFNCFKNLGSVWRIVSFQNSPISRPDLKINHAFSVCAVFGSASVKTFPWQVIGIEHSLDNLTDLSLASFGGQINNWSHSRAFGQSHPPEIAHSPSPRRLRNEIYPFPRVKRDPVHTSLDMLTS
jgi:hypothetical protein